MSLADEIPSDLIMELDADDLARPLLKYLARSEASKAKLNRYNFGLDCDRAYGDERIRDALLEAWAVLEREGAITRTHDDFYVVSKRGRKMLEEGNGSAQFTQLLPRELLHPRLSPGATRAFARGEYPAAVREAFMEVEIAVRDVGDFAADKVGIELMNLAFNPEKGPLTDRTLPIAEQKATRDVFVGAIGLFRNPPSHRRVTLGPSDAARTIVFASHLLSIVDARRPVDKPPRQNP